MKRFEITRSRLAGRGRKISCVLAALLMLVTFGLTAVTTSAGAATPPPAPTGLAPDGGNAGPNPVLTWDAVPGAAYYMVKHPDANGNQREDRVYATSYATTVDYPLGVVSWSVQSIGEGNTPGGSASASFNNTSSSAPHLTCPTSPVRFPAESPKFSWTPVRGAKNYTLQVSTTETFTPASTETFTTQATTYTLTEGVPDNQEYHAKVSATTYNNTNTRASSTCDFTVVWRPGTGDSSAAKPTLRSPKDTATVRDVVLRWDALEGAASYEVQISPNGDWANNLYYDVITASTTWSPAKTLNNGSYYWRVRGIDNAGNFSAWSDSWLLSVTPLAAPEPVFPDADATIANPDLRFSWKPVPGAAAYELQWADGPSFSYSSQNDEINHTCITNHTDWSPYSYVNPPGQFGGPGGRGACRANARDQVPNFVAGTTVYWRVRSLDDYTTNELASPWSTNGFDTTNHRPSNNRAFVSTWSTPRRFFFNSTVPMIKSPASGTTVTTPEMTWTRVAGAQNYLVTYTTNFWRWDNNTKSCIPPTGNPGTRVARTSALSFTPSLVGVPRAPDTDRDPDSDWDQCPIDVGFTVQAVDYSGRLSPLPPLRSFTWGGYSLTGLTTGPTIQLDPTSVAPNGQTVNPLNGATVDEIPRFNWKPVAGADHYQVRWYDNPAGQVFVPMQDFNIGGSQMDPFTESFTPTQPIDAATGAWDVIALDAANNVIASSPKRTLTVAPPAPVTITGLTTRMHDGSSNCNVNGRVEADCTTWPDGATIPSTPLITWETNDKADSYRVYIALDPGFTNVQRVYWTGQNSIRPVESLPDNQAGQSYYVAVQPVRNNWRTGGLYVTSTVYGDYGAAIDPANVWSFRKQSAAVTGLKVLAPTSAAPSDSTNICDDGSGVSTFSDTPTFCWNESSTAPYTSGDDGSGTNQQGDVGAMSYHIQVASTPDFSNLIDEAWVDQASYTPYEWPMQSNGGYSPQSTGAPTWRPNYRTYPDGPIYWRVQAVDATGNSLTYGTYGVIESNDRPEPVMKDTAAVTLDGPGQGTDVGSTPSLSWESKPFAARYQVEVARSGDENFSEPNIAFRQFTDLTSITPSDNNRLDGGTSLPEGEYAWRVRAVDADNNSGAWSEVRTFMVVPSPPDLTSPGNNLTFAEFADLTFKWTAVEGAVRYRIRVTQSSPPTTGGIVVDTVSNAWSLDRPLQNGNWYWQVASLDAQSRVLATSTPRSFRVLGTRPVATNLTAAGNAYRSIALSWSAAPGDSPITSFVINLYSSSSASTPTTTKTVSASTRSNTWPNLTANTRYWFTVSAVDQYGPGPESNRATAIAPGYTAVQSFVYAAYNDFLGRNPTSSQLNAATAYLGANPAPSRKADWLQALANSPAWVNAIVNQFYLDTLGRAGEPGGVAYWSGQIATGQKTVAEVASSFYASDEYFDGQYGQSNLTIWVRDLYAKILNRAPDSGVSYWVSAVSVHANPNAFAGRLWVAYNFYQSQESRQKRVTDLYQKLLHRDPDHEGLLYWAGRILDEGDIALAVSLASSDEYYSRAQTRYPG